MYDLSEGVVLFLDGERLDRGWILIVRIELQTFNYTSSRS